MKLLNSRKGDWIQIFLVLFFFLLLIITIMLLFLEKNTFAATRAQVSEDVIYVKANSFLINSLRHPVEGIDINGDGSPDPTTLAELIVLNKNRTNDDRISTEIKKIFGERYIYQLYIWYNGEIPEGLWEKFIDVIGGDHQQVRNARLLGSPHAPYDKYENIAVLDLQLPGGETMIRMAFADETTRIRDDPVREYLEKRGLLE